ncbi:MAG: hypothetical protein K0U64_10955 [Actinomycetia bacterium]|nr:hypothetical protein [Actinomycetes bacterium]
MAKPSARSPQPKHSGVRDVMMSPTVGLAGAETEEPDLALKAGVPEVLGGTPVSAPEAVMIPRYRR